MSLRTFCLRIFQHCPLLASFSVENHTRAFEEFLQYKTRVPVRGAILLNETMDSTVLVKGWKKNASWSFPRGKINKDEDDLDCAIREVWEETGLDLRAAGLVPKGKPKYIEINMRDQQMRLYVFRDIPMNTHFQPQTRKEISKIAWYKLSDLPAFRKKGGQSNNNNNNNEARTNANKFYMVAPFLVPLKKWVVSQKKSAAKQAAVVGGRSDELGQQMSFDEAPTEDDIFLQTAVPTAAPGPALDTIDGATDELRRLLKIQRPTQGLQSQSSQEDKATALLSMLKLGGPAPHEHQQQPTSQLPHTPQELTVGEAPQPRNPHHHTNQQHYPPSINQQPPSFHVQQHQQYQGPAWNAAHQQQPYPGNLPLPGFDRASPHIQGTSQQAPLVHPQPLPPQVQRSMYNNSTFLENPLKAPPQHAQPPPPLQQQQQQQQPPPGSAPQEPPQPTILPTAGRSRLDGQSLALLNAFKRDSGAMPSTQPPEHIRAAQGGYPVNQAPDYSKQAPAPQNLPLPSELADSTPQKPPVAAPKPTSYAPADPHRSALLGMFKNDQANPPPQGAHILQRGHTDGTTLEKQLVDNLRQAPSGPVTHPQAAPARQAANPGAALSDFLSLKLQTEQPVPTGSRGSDHGSAGRRQPSAGSNPAAQPIRILQRPQGADALHFSDQQNRGPARSPYSAQGPSSYTSPPVSAARPSPGSSQRPSAEPPHDQKRNQLLSLFGNKQQQQHQTAGINTTAHAPVEVGPGQTLPASQQGNETPMSPAEQTFLLDYLQSVTGGTSR